jgi:DNA-binding Lrp family transcriptional regulator
MTQEFQVGWQFPMGKFTEETVMNIWAYVFITTKEPRKVVQAIRKISGVVKADALLGTPDAIAIVEGSDIRSMDAVIDKIVEVPGVLGTDSKVARWID